MSNGFKLSRSDLEGTNRFGPGYSLGSTPAISDAEFMKHHNGMMAPGMLQVTARLTRNVPLPHFLTVNKSISRPIGAVVRFFGGSITYGSLAPGAEGGINHILFNPKDQVISQERIR